MTAGPVHAGGVEHPPIVVHQLSPTGGRRVTVRGHRVGLAHSDHDLVVFLEAAGLHDPEALLDDPHWVAWLGGRAHEWDAV